MKYLDFESHSLEFKEYLPQKGQILKSVIGFCNQFGGRIIIGVRDDREIIGLNEHDIPGLIDSISSNVFNSTTPKIVPYIYPQSISDKILLVVEVSRGMQCPYFITSKGLNKGTYLRMGASTILAHKEIIDELLFKSRGLSIDQYPLYEASEKDLDIKQIINQLPKRYKGVKQLSKKQLFSLKLLHEENKQVWPTMASILLFNNEPQRYCSEAFIICTQFKGNEGREILSTKDCAGNLFEQIHSAYHFVESHIHYKSSIKNIQREDSLELPAIAIREGIINAVVHRNYNINSPIKIAIYDDRIEIFSPGNFPGPIDLKQIELGVTYVRNKVIVSIMREAGIVEKLGSGLLTIFKEFEKAHLAEPVLREGVNFVKLTLPRFEINLSHTLNDQLVEIIRKKGSCSILYLNTVISLSKSSITRSLNQLISKDILIRKGNTRNTMYSIR